VRLGELGLEVFGPRQGAQFAKRRLDRIRLSGDRPVDAFLGQQNRALDAEAVVQANVEAEAKERKSEVSRLDGRIDFITSNVDGAAIDSLSEIVAQFSQNGQGYASRLAYLEAVISALVAKTQ
jgi:hypothetical protein